MTDLDKLRSEWAKVVQVYGSAFPEEAQAGRRVEAGRILFDIELSGHDAALAKVLPELSAALARIAKVEAVVRLLSPDDITPAGKRILERALAQGDPDAAM